MKAPDNTRQMAIRILHYANLGVSRYGFLRQISKILLRFFECEVINFILEDGKHILLSKSCSSDKSFKLQYYILEELLNEPEKLPDKLTDIFLEVLHGEQEPESQFLTGDGSFWCRRSDTDTAGPECPIMDFPNILAMPFVIDDRNSGVLVLKGLKYADVDETTLVLYESLAQNIGSAIASRRTRSECHERVKELTCLYGINRLARNSKITMKELLQAAAALLPPAWQYPDVTIARINLDGTSYSTDEFNNPPHKQTADIVIRDEIRGTVEVAYIKPQPPIYEGPYLREERDLIDTVSLEIAKVIDKLETEDYQSKLQDQLRHADRLATLGQLSAAIAHELNEPLGAILGFSQLAVKTDGLPEQVVSDLNKITKASLHAREVIKKLLTFARDVQSTRSYVDLNDLITKGLYFLESRMAKDGIKLVHDLSPDTPQIKADAAQMHQVLVNLVVNAIHAMPDGGQLKIGTYVDRDYVALSVGDTGAGMTPDILSRIFMPFFTTKDPDQGTGLGLAVVQTIVVAHNGQISVDSAPGEGSLFTVKFPIYSGDDAEEE